MRNLSELIRSGKLVKLLEAHSPLCASVVQQSEFDGMWSSSLADSALMAVPDCEYLGLHKRLDHVQYMLNASNKPLIMDVDSGGHVDHFCMHLPAIQRMGISGVIVEDKTGYKRNSLYGSNNDQKQDTPENFSLKLKAASNLIQNSDFLMVSRIESLILGETVEQALHRARMYIDNGTNAIMIHSVESHPEQLLKFVDQFRASDQTTPVFVVPTTFNRIRGKDLHNAGINVVIYANHMIRASLGAMKSTAEQIFRDDMSYHADESITPVKELLKLIPENDPSHRFN